MTVTPITRDRKKCKWCEDAPATRAGYCEPCIVNENALEWGDHMDGEEANEARDRGLHVREL